MGQREFEQLLKAERLEREGLGGADAYTMWLPGYDRSRDEAVIYYYRYCGDLDGWGGSLRLRREGKQWRIVERRCEWSS